MSAEQGFDDMFDDGLWVSSLRTSTRAAPAQWPKSVSGMRGHTEYLNQGLSENIDIGHSDYIARTASPAYGNGWRQENGLSVWRPY